MELKHIYLLHHSHYDRGYTHSQVVLEHLQWDFIDQAMAMLEETADWEPQSQPRWTIEVHEQLRLWIKTASAGQIERMRSLVAQGRMGLGAIQFNTTPQTHPVLFDRSKKLLDTRKTTEISGSSEKMLSSLLIS